MSAALQPGQLVPLAPFLAALLCGAAARRPAAEPWTLERAIEFAIANSPDARIAQERIAAARAGIEEANSALWPQAQLQSSYIRTDNPLGVFGAALSQRSFSPSLDFNDVPDADDLNVQGMITIPLYAGGRIASGRAAAKANSEAAKAAGQAVRNRLEFETARAFHTILKTRQFVRAAAAAVRSYENNLGIVTNRFATGAALKNDVLDMEVRLAQAREDLARARNAVALSERALRDLLGIAEGPFSVADAAPDPALPQTVDFSRRPELAAARQSERAAEAEVRRAKAGYKPRVSAFGAADYDRGWKFGGDGESYTAGVMARWDLWNGNRTRSRVRRAVANLEAAQEEEHKLRLRIDLEVEQARLQLNEANERLAVSAAAVAEAQESEDLTRARFQQGLALATQLIDSETALTSARVRRAEAQASRSIAIAALRQALGLPQLPNVP